MRLQLIEKFNSETEDIISTVNSITNKFTNQLDECIKEVKELLNSGDEISPEQLNYYVSLIPVLLYDLTGRITELGVKSDAAKMQRKQVFNDS